MISPRSLGPFAVATLLIAALVGTSIAVFDRLPETIPVHFTMAGEADRFETKTLLAWLDLPLVGLGIVVLMVVLAWLLPRFPNAINVPGPQRFSELPPAAQRRIVELLRMMLGYAALMPAALFSLLQLARWRVAHGVPSEWLVISALLGTIVIMPIPALVLLVKLNSASKP